MGRAEERRSKREKEKAKTATYNFTKEQLDEEVRKRVRKEAELVKKEVTEEAVSNAMLLLFALPPKILKDHYWTKSYQQRVPKFADYLAEYYEKWDNGELNMEELQQELWETCGIRFGFDGEEDKTEDDSH